MENTLATRQAKPLRVRIRQLIARLTMPLFLLPAIVLLAIFYIWPFMTLFQRSLFSPELTLENYQRVFASPAVAIYFSTTVSISVSVLVIAILLGYPVAYLMNAVKPRTASILLIVVVLPFFTSFLIRTYALTLVLGRQGFINSGLMAVGLISEPLSILYTRAAVFLGLLQTLIPLMVLPLFAVMRGIDKELVSAARNLGASPLQAFLKVFFPLSLPGVAAGGVLVFITSMGAYLTARFLGGPADQMLANFIENQVLRVSRFDLASAEAALLLVITLGMFFFTQRVLKVNLITGWRE